MRAGAGRRRKVPEGSAHVVKRGIRIMLLLLGIPPQLIFWIILENMLARNPTYLAWFGSRYFLHIFPEFNLESYGHSWFQRDTWPEDFTGRGEPWYYHEAMFKRFRGEARCFCGFLDDVGRSRPKHLVALKMFWAQFLKS